MFLRIYITLKLLFNGLNLFTKMYVEVVSLHIFYVEICRLRAEDGCESIWASPLFGCGARFVSGVSLLERACDLGFHIGRHDGRLQVSLWTAGSAFSLALVFDA